MIPNATGIGLFLHLGSPVWPVALPLQSHGCHRLRSFHRDSWRRASNGVATRQGPPSLPPSLALASSTGPCRAGKWSASNFPAGRVSSPSMTLSTKRDCMCSASAARRLGFSNGEVGQDSRESMHYEFNLVNGSPLDQIQRTTAKLDVSRSPLSYPYCA